MYVCVQEGVADGGTHWGLLVWDRRELTSALTGMQANSISDSTTTSTGRFVYYDSGFFRSSCQLQADRLASKLVGQRVRTILGESARQDNFYDCGMYVLMFSELIIDSFLKQCRDESASSDAFICTPAWEKSIRSLKPADVTRRRAAIFSWLRRIDNVESLAATGGG